LSITSITRASTHTLSIAIVFQFLVFVKTAFSSYMSTYFHVLTLKGCAYLWIETFNNINLHISHNFKTISFAFTLIITFILTFLVMLWIVFSFFFN
jgi:hypothetical protein